MKTIILMRHADSYPTDFVGYEEERSLSVTGLLQMETIRAAHYPFWQNVDFVMCSSLKRTRQTFYAIKTDLPPNINFVFDDRMSQMTKNELLDKIQWLPSLYDCVLIIGHNPCLSQFVSAVELSATTTLGTAHIVMCEADVLDWQDVSFNRIEVRKNIALRVERENR